MRMREVLAAACVTASLALAVQAAQGPAPGAPPAQGSAAAAATRQGGPRGNAGAASGAPIGGTLTPAKADERGWGWQVKASVPMVPSP